jgi:ATP/ADP translocase
MDLGLGYQNKRSAELYSRSIIYFWLINNHIQGVKRVQKFLPLIFIVLLLASCASSHHSHKHKK